MTVKIIRKSMLLMVVLLLCMMSTISFAQDDSLGDTAWGDGQVIVFSSRRNGNADLYMMRLDGTNEIRLTYDTSNDLFPSISPIGGNLVAFHSDRSGTWQIYILTLNAGTIEQVTTDGQNYYPEWSPDGTQLVFSHTDGTDYELYTVDLASEDREMHPLTSISGNAYLPHWSPDGSQIVFTLSDGDGELWLVDTVSGELTRQLTDNDIWDTDPKFSPDGRYVVHTRGDYGADEIFVLDVDSGASYQLTENTDNDIDPTWTRDGKYIVFVSDRDGGNNLYIMTRNGQDVRALTMGGDDNATPATGILGYNIQADTFLP